MHFFRIFLSAGLLSASAGTAATVGAEYEASASIFVRLLSATYESSGADASSALSRGTWQDGGDSFVYASGTGYQLRGGGGAWLLAEPAHSFSRTSLTGGHADETDTYGASGIADYITPTVNYSHACARRSVEDCAGVDRILVELAYGVETEARSTGGATARAEAFLGMEYFQFPEDAIYYNPWRPVDGWDFSAEASGNSVSGGTLLFAMDAGSALGFDLYTEFVGGQASYTPPLSTPLPATIPLMSSGLVLLGLIARRRTRRD